MARNPFSLQELTRRGRFLFLLHTCLCFRCVKICVFSSLCHETISSSSFLYIQDHHNDCLRHLAASSGIYNAFNIVNTTGQITGEVSQIVYCAKTDFVYATLSGRESFVAERTGSWDSCKGRWFWWRLDSCSQAIHCFEKWTRASWNRERHPILNRIPSIVTLNVYTAASLTPYWPTGKKITFELLFKYFCLHEIDHILLTGN